MFEYVKKSLIKEDDEKCERSKRESYQVNELRDKLNLFYPKVDDIIEEYTKEKRVI